MDLMAFVERNLINNSNASKIIDLDSLTRYLTGIMILCIDLHAHSLSSKSHIHTNTRQSNINRSHYASLNTCNAQSIPNHKTKPEIPVYALAQRVTRRKQRNKPRKRAFPPGYKQQKEWNCPASHTSCGLLWYKLVKHKNQNRKEK